MPFQKPLSPEATEAIDQAVRLRFQHVDDTLKKLQHQLFRRWLVAMLGLLIAYGGFYYATHKADSTSHQAKIIATQVVIQRREAIWLSCRAQNKRHDNTITRLNANSKEALTPARIKVFQQELATIGIRVTPAQARHFQVLSSAQNQTTVALINALVPHQDCQQLVNQQAPLLGTHS